MTPSPRDERPAGERHVPVLLQRCVDLLAPAAQVPGAVIIDATLGMGGHTEALLEACPDARVVGVDRDPQALALASERLQGFGARFLAVHAVYDQMPEVLARAGVTEVAGVLMDLGVSSLQIDEADRGFAYAQDAPLDMRMNPGDPLTAADVLNTYSEADLVRILRDYGEERHAARIVRAVVARRDEHPVLRSGELVELIRSCLPAAVRYAPGGSPAKRTFQALRIEVNRELEVLARAVPAAVEALAVGGRIVVMSYHSLEDRLVKQELARGASSSSPLGLPVELETHRPYLRLLTRGAEEADTQEQERNPRSASVRLRAAERLRPTPDHLRPSQRHQDETRHRRGRAA